MNGPAAGLALGLLLSGAVCLNAQEQRTMHVYHIGNSLTRSLTMDRLHLLFAEHGIDYQFSTQLAGGCTLKRHWAAREARMKTKQWETNVPAGDTYEPGGPDWDPNPKRFGPYWEALTQHKWDAVVFQPSLSHMRDDLPALRKFIGYALEHGTTDRFFIYQAWPKRPVANPEEKDRAKRVYGDIAYQRIWEREYPFDEATPDPKGDAFMSRDYTDKLLARVNGEFAEELETPVRLIPVGEVWYECDKRIKSGEIPGLAELYGRDAKLVPGWDPATGAAAGVNVFYADGIHPNPIPHLDGNVANYVNGLTVCTVISGEPPLDLPASIYGLDDDLDSALIEALRKAVWQVVTDEPNTGVAAR